MGKGSNTTSNSTTTAPNPQAAAAYSSLLNQAQGVASTPYQAYTGELTAPVNSQQQAGISNINANANYAQPYVQQAAGIAGAAANPLTAQQIQNYQNPYTQDVVNATQAQFNNQNQQQQQGLTGNAIAQGALGGNRVGVAQANLAGQQQLAQAPTIAGLYSNSYNTGLATAAQQYQQNPLAAAGALANFGISGQNAALSGAGAQLGAGTLQQQTQQAADTANYGQYAQSQAYPFQTTQWLAGIDTGVGSQLGGTSSGQTTAPPPNQTAQYLGLGLAGAGLFLNRGGRVGYANGGGVQHLADGGVSGTPWSQGVGWVPSINIASGHGAPSGSAPGVAQTPAFNATQFANQITSLGGGKGSGSGIGNSLGAIFNPEAYGASETGIGGAGAYGGSSSSPLPGLDASDYGEGFKRGGGVRGYADGGAPDFADRFQPAVDSPMGAMPLQQGLALAGPDSGVINPDQPYRMPSPEAVQAWRDQTPIPNVSQGVSPAVTPAKEEADDEIPENAAPTSGVAPAGYTPPYQITPADYAPPSHDKDSGFGFGLISPNAKSGLLAAGLGMLASRSPFLGNAIGEGGLSGLAAYSSANEKDQKAQQDAQKLSLEAKQAANALSLSTYNVNHKGDMTDYQEAEIALKKQQLAKEYKPTFGVIREEQDPDTGQVHKVYGWIDPNKKTTSVPESTVPAGAPPPAPKVDANGLPLTGDDYLKTIPSNRATLAKQIADYKVNPAGLSVRGGHREQAIADATRYNPDYDQRLFTASNRAMSNFYGGPEGRTIRSLNVAIDHLHTLDTAVDALKNGDIPALNKITNYFSQQTGNPVTTNFDSIKHVVSAEIAKAVVGGQTALHDRDDMAARAANSGSPDQLHGIVTEFKKLMAGQMGGLKKQYEVTTRAKNFDDFLEPQTKKELAGLAGNETSAASEKSQAPAVPPGAVGKMKDTTGKYWYVDKDNKPLGPMQ